MARKRTSSPNSIEAVSRAPCSSCTRPKRSIFRPATRSRETWEKPLRDYPRKGPHFTFVFTSNRSPSASRRFSPNDRATCVAGEGRFDLGLRRCSSPFLFRERGEITRNRIVLALETTYVPAPSTYRPPFAADSVRETKERHLATFFARFWLRSEAFEKL